MSLYTRRYRPAFGMRETRTIHSTGDGLFFVLQSSPLSSFFVSPVTQPNAKAIYAYFTATQIKRYGKTLELPERATLAHIKRALREHTPEYLCRAVRYGSMISFYAFSIPAALRWFADVGREFDTLRPRYDTGTDFSPGCTVTLWG